MTCWILVKQPNFIDKHNPKTYPKTNFWAFGTMAFSLNSFGHHDTMFTSAPPPRNNLYTKVFNKGYLDTDYFTLRNWALNLQIKGFTL